MKKIILKLIWMGSFRAGKFPSFHFIVLMHFFTAIALYMLFSKEDFFQNNRFRGALTNYLFFFIVVNIENLCGYIIENIWICKSI